MSSVDKKKPRYWRSLAELEGDPKFQEFVEREFAAPLENEPPDSDGRRRFMQLMGASLALAGVTGCRYEEDKLLPFSRRPEGMVPGEPRYYATAMELSGVSTSLHAKSYDGRPIKIEGNPGHPFSLGACNVFHQASILELYDPDRSQHVVRVEGRQNQTWAEFEKFAREHFNQLRQKGGQGLAVLSDGSASPTLMAQKQRLLAAFPQAKWFAYDPVSRDNEREGAVLAFGKPYRTTFKLREAKVILSLDSDLLDNHPAALANARELVQGRQPESGDMNRIYAVENTFTLLGSMADHRLALRAEQILAFAAALDAEISAKANPLPEAGAAQPKPAAEFLKEAHAAKFLASLVSDLVSDKNIGKSVVVAGPNQPPQVHALVHRINRVLGNLSSTVQLYEIDDERPGHFAAIKELTADLKAGKVDTLVILGGNPAYDAPADLGFAEALSSAKTKIRAGIYEDETSARATWHLPLAHFLETWADGRAADGSLTFAQPLIAPLFGGRSAIEIMALVLNEPSENNGQSLVRRTHGALLADPRRFRKAVHDGFLPRAAAEPTGVPDLKPLDKIEIGERALGAEPANGQLELTFAPCPKLYDGRYANNGWLQELPDPITKLTWDNAVLMSPATAKKLNVTDRSVVTLTLNGKSVKLPVIQCPGHANGSLLVRLGYGRKRAGQVGGLDSANVESVGVDTYALRGSEAPYIAAGAQVSATGEQYHLAVTQDLHAIDQTGEQGRGEERLGMLVREADLKEFANAPDFAKHAVHHPPLLSLWEAPVSYDGHKWGMSIDLNKCMGCNACVVACVAENNIPVTGRDRVRMGREMHWIRVDRYFRGTPEEPKVSWQPVACQQCENAPCEQVCPVGATMHSSEGLNDMVYNRCIGTRYCSNNCPYKVRRFNYFNYHLDVQGMLPWSGYPDDAARTKSMAYNPEVSLRARGVMEKCTFCVQRIQNAKIPAKNARRQLKDGEIVTACQQTCPTGAIVFGDLNDKSSKVAELQNRPRSYALLEELNNRPRNQYLAQVRNPNSELG